jgi:hypothetical protein
MTSIYDLPFEDIQKFLAANNVNYEDERDAYNKTLKLLKNKNSIGHTTHIIEWMIAHNLLFNKVNIPSFSSYEIENMSQSQINDLSRLLTMKGNNIDNIINILRYMDKLKDMELLPEIMDIIGNLSNESETQEINLDSLNFDEIIYLLTNHYHKELIRNFIYNNIETIINNVEKKSKNDTEKTIDNITEFITKLLVLNEIGLSKEVLNIALEKNYKFPKSYDDFRSLYSLLLYKVIDYNDPANNELFERFFKLINDKSLIKAAYGNVGDIMSEGLQDYRYSYTTIKAVEKLHIPFLKTSIKLEKIELIIYVVDLWENYLRELYNEDKERVYFDEDFEKIELLLEELENLIIEGKELIKERMDDSYESDESE